MDGKLNMNDNLRWSGTGMAAPKPDLGVNLPSIKFDASNAFWWFLGGAGIAIGVAMLSKRLSKLTNELFVW